jgi:hypothetical protein
MEDPEIYIRGLTPPLGPRSWRAARVRLSVQRRGTDPAPIRDRPDNTSTKAAPAPAECYFSATEELKTQNTRAPPVAVTNVPRSIRRGYDEWLTQAKL